MIQQSTAHKLSEHEAVCAERYQQINDRLKRIETILLKSAAILLIAMAGVIWSSIIMKG